MNDDSDRPTSDEELEALLRRLEPMPLQVDFVAELRRDRERIAIAQSHSPAKMQWRRVIPLTLVGTLAMVGFALYQHGATLFPVDPPSSEVASAASPLAPAPAAEPQFVPVSMQGYLMKTSAGGVVETEAGPRQKLQVDYQDAYHWHDPASGTNIRYFEPRREEVFVPLSTD